MFIFQLWQFLWGIFVDDTTGGAKTASEDAHNAPKSSFENLGTIDSIDGRPTLPFSVKALVISFVILYFTSVLDFVLGFGNPLFEIDSMTRFLVAAFLSFGIAIFWEYIF